MTGRHLLGSLLIVAVLSGGVVAEAERNYAAVTDVEGTTASVASATADGDGVSVTLTVDNGMGEALRIQYVYLTVSRENGTATTSVPYQGYERLPQGESTLRTGVPARQFDEAPAPGETVTVRGYLAVEVYNGYRFEIPIAEREVTL